MCSLTCFWSLWLRCGCLKNVKTRINLHGWWCFSSWFDGSTTLLIFLSALWYVVRWREQWIFSWHGWSNRVRFVIAPFSVSYCFCFVGFMETLAWFFIFNVRILCGLCWQIWCFITDELDRQFSLQFGPAAVLPSHFCSEQRAALLCLYNNSPKDLCSQILINL